MTTKIQKWGNSLAMRLPKELAKNLNWHAGAVVGFEQLGDKVIITSSRPEYTLEDMVKSIIGISLCGQMINHEVKKYGKRFSDSRKRGHRVD